MEEEKPTERVEKKENPGEKETESLTVVDKRQLDLQLRDKGVLLVPQQLVQPYTKDFIIAIRNARDFEKRHLYRQQVEQADFRSIRDQISNITYNNKRVENQIKMELLGLENSPLKRFGFSILQFVHYLKGTPQGKAEDIIYAQLRAIEKVTNDLGIASQIMDKKIFDLERYHDKVLLYLLEKYGDRNRTLEEIKETADLMSDTENVTENAKDFIERMVYSGAHRKLKKKLQENVFKLKLTNKAMLLLKNELPLLDNLSSICEAYSNSLKETGQEAIHMSRHLDNVIGLYFDMMRSQRINMNLEGEVKKLFTYTNRMNNSLRNGAYQIVERANQSDLFVDEYRRRALTLDTVLNDIENSNSRAFRELENKISGYLTK